MHLEFTYLSDITGNPVFKSKVENVRKVLKNLEKPKGLYPNYIHPKTGKWGQRELILFRLFISLFASKLQKDTSQISNPKIRRFKLVSFNLFLFIYCFYFLEVHFKNWGRKLEELRGVAIHQNVSQKLFFEIYSNKLNSVSFIRVSLVELVERKEREALNSNDKSREVLYTISKSNPEQPKSSIPAATIAASLAKTSEA